MLTCCTLQASTAGVAKVLVVGDVATGHPSQEMVSELCMCVGKTSAIQRYVKNVFSKDYQTTIGVDFALKKVHANGLDINVQLWDIAGNLCSPPFSAVHRCAQVRSDFLDFHGCIRCLFGVFSHCVCFLFRSSTHMLSLRLLSTICSTASLLTQRRNGNGSVQFVFVVHCFLFLFVLCVAYC